MIIFGANYNDFLRSLYDQLLPKNRISILGQLPLIIFNNNVQGQYTAGSVLGSLNYPQYVAVKQDIKDRLTGSSYQFSNSSAIGIVAFTAEQLYDFGYVSSNAIFENNIEKEVNWAGRLSYDGTSYISKPSDFKNDTVLQDRLTDLAMRKVFRNVIGTGVIDNSNPPHEVAGYLTVASVTKKFLSATDFRFGSPSSYSIDAGIHGDAVQTVFYQSASSNIAESLLDTLLNYNQLQQSDIITLKSQISDIVGVDTATNIINLAREYAETLNITYYQQLQVEILKVQTTLTQIIKSSITSISDSRNPTTPDSLPYSLDRFLRTPDGALVTNKSIQAGEPAIPRLAHGQGVDVNKTIISDKRDRKILDVPVAMTSDKWSEPNPAYNTQYPFNRVYQTKNGLVEEFDDTPNNVRYHLYHPSGTFKEIDNGGTQINHIVGDEYHIIEKNGKIYIEGRCDVTVKGPVNIYAMNDCNLQVDGNMTAVVRNDTSLTVSGSIKVNAKEDFIVKANNIMFECTKFDYNVSDSYNIVSNTVSISTENKLLLQAGTNFFQRAKQKIVHLATDEYFNVGMVYATAGAFGRETIGSATFVAATLGTAEVPDANQVIPTQFSAPAARVNKGPYIEKVSTGNISLLDNPVNDTEGLA